MEAVGVGLAVVGLAGQCFSGAIKALHLIATARNMRSEHRYLTIRLRLELQRLFNWATSGGLVAYIYDDEQTSLLDSNLIGVNRSIILEVLSQIEELAVRFIRHKKRYSDLFAPADSGSDSIQRSDTIVLNDPAQDADQDIESFLVVAWSSMKAIDLPRKIRWATMDKDRYEELTNKLKQLVDSLLGLVNDSTSKATYDLTQETNKSILQLHNKLEDLNILVQALTFNSKDAPFFAQGYSIPSGKSTAMTHGKEMSSLLDLARFRALNKVIESSSAADVQFVQSLPKYIESSLQVTDIAIARENIKITNTQEYSPGHLDAGVYMPNEVRRERVYVEWKPFKPVNAKFEPDSGIRLRVEKLTTLLKGGNKPAAFRIPNYLGFFLDTGVDGYESDEDDASISGCRFGLVFSMPTVVEAQANIQTLRNLLDSIGTPSLTSRVCMAQKIALSVVSLHSVDWLHKGIRSSAVIFPSRQSGGNEVPKLQEPFICGFEYSRPAVVDEFTEAPLAMRDDRLYRHPNAFDPDAGTGESFRMSFDIYSLGIVLLEILCWRSITSILDLKRPGRTSPDYVRRRLLENSSVSDMLAAAAGDSIRDAVMTCLRAPESLLEERRLDETSDAGRYLVSRIFQQKVSRPLNAAAW